MTKEMLEVLDEHGQETGTTKSKTDILRDGAWRKVVHVWVVGSGGGLLVQKRAAGIATFENLLDVSVGGGVRSGEDSREAGARELYEELGIVCTPEELEYLGRWQQAPKPIPAGQDGQIMHDNDFSDTFLLRRNVNPRSLVLQPEEVATVEILPLIQFREKIKDPLQYARWVPHGVDYYLGVADAITTRMGIT